MKEGLTESEKMLLNQMVDKDPFAVIGSVSLKLQKQYYMTHQFSFREIVKAVGKYNTICGENG